MLRRERQRSPRRLALRGVALGVLVLVGLEVGLRLIAPQPERGLSRGLFLHRDGLSAMVPGAVGTQVSRDFSVAIEGGADGYRAGTSSALEPGVARVWCFGDSQAFGWGVEAGETFSARLAAEGIAVANRALPGDGIAEYARRLDAELATGRTPRAVCVLFYDNDLLDGGVRAPGGLRLRSVLLRLHVARLAARVLDGLGWADAVAESTGTRSARDEGLRADLELHRRSAPSPIAKLDALRALLQRASETGAPVLLVRVVPVHAAGGVATNRALERIGESRDAFRFGALDATLEAIATERDARYARFGPASETEERARYFPNDLHLTPAGHAALAELVRSELGELGVR